MKHPSKAARLMSPTPESRWDQFFNMADEDSLTTLHQAVRTSAAGTVARALYPSPGTAAIPGRPCHGVTYAGATTDQVNWCIGTASIIPQINEPITFWGGFAFTDLTCEFALGLTAVSTGLLAADGANMLTLSKINSESVPRIRSIKAGGTAESVALPITFVTGSWYDFVLDIWRDPVTTGRGYVDVWWKKDGLCGAGPDGGVRVNISTQFPDTIVTAPACCVRPYTSGKAVYVSHWGWRVGRPV